MKFTRFLPLLIPILIYFLLEIFYFWPQTIYLVLILLFGLFFISTLFFTRRSRKKEKWWNFFILPSYFITGLVVFSSLLPSRLLVQLLFFLAVIIQYFYFHTIYDYLVKIEDYREYSLENISSYGNFLGIYFTSSAIYGLLSFLNFSVWLAMLLLVIIVGLAVYQVFWANGIKLKLGIFYILLSSLVLAEIAWTATFLPLSFYILGLFFSVCYYMLIGLLRFHLLKKLDDRVVRLYLLYGFGSILLVLLTAKWM